MSEKEMIVLKMNLLGGMHTYVMNLNDESAYMRWIQIVPDQADEDDLKFIAEDKKLWIDVCKAFGKLVQEYGE